MLTPDEVRHFIASQTIHAFDPLTRLWAAAVTYACDGTCTAEFADGGKDTGVYGFSGAAYWTRYARFRDGGTFAFRLQRLAPGVMQAWFTTGERAFVQSDHPDPAHWRDLSPG